METLKNALTEEFSSKKAKENPQILITTLQIFCGFIIGAIGASFAGISESLEANAWIVCIPLGLCIFLPMLSKFKGLCSSEFLRKFSFYLFSLSIGMVLLYSSLLFSGFFYALWLYLGTALLLFYEYNGISQCEMKKSFKFVVFGLVIISIGLFLVVVLVDFNVWYLLGIVSNI